MKKIAIVFVFSLGLISCSDNDAVSAPESPVKSIDSYADEYLQILEEGVVLLEKVDPTAPSEIFIEHFSKAREIENHMTKFEKEVVDKFGKAAWEKVFTENPEYRARIITLYTRSEKAKENLIKKMR